MRDFMNKIIFAPLFTMLIISCGTVLPSSSSISNSVSLNSVSSSTFSSNSSSNNSSISFPSSNSSASSSIEEPVNNRKVPFNEIGSLVAQVVDAKALGIINNKSRPQLSGKKNIQEADQNYMVKLTETYNPNTKISEDQTIQVTFSRVTNTQTT